MVVHAQAAATRPLFSPTIWPGNEATMCADVLMRMFIHVGVLV